MLFNNINDSIFIQDLESKFLDVNQTACDSLGYTKEQLLKMSPKDIFSPDLAPIVAERIKNLPQKGSLFIRSAHVCKNGNVIPIEVNSKIVEYEGKPAVLSIARDISERKIMESKLKESEKKFRGLFDNISSGVAIYEAVCDGEDFIFKDFNKAGEKIENINKKDLINKRLLEIFPGVKDFGLFDVFQRVWRTGKPEYHPISLYKDERIMGWRENYVYKLPTGEIVAVYDDITERKKAEIILRESEKKYREAYDRAIFYKDLFTHDIGNIFQVLKSSLELSSMYLKLNVTTEKMEELVQIANEQMTRGIQLISNIRKLSDIEDSAFSLKLMDMIKYLEKAVTLLKSNYKDKEIQVNIVVNSRRKEFHVKANELLADLVENILNNAVIHNENPIINIFIKISRTEEKTRKYMRLEFIDNGMGVSDPRKERIFMRGIKEYHDIKGMGLGLALVSKIIDSYDGRIWVEDKVKGDHTQGSNFIVVLPEAVE